MEIVKHLISRLKGYYVILDPEDNSVTLSKKLFKHIRKNAKDSKKTNVFVFKIKDINKDTSFGFIINPNITQETQMTNIQYNDKHKCIGFETLCPSVGQILYTYQLEAQHKYKLAVCVRKTNDNIFYEIKRP